MKQKKNKGISLIVLIITIVVIIILATAIIVNLARTNIINNANEAVVKQDFKTFQDELNLYAADQFVQKSGGFDLATFNANKETNPTVYEVIKSLENSRYKDDVTIVNGKITLSENVDAQIKEWAMSGISISGNTNLGNNVQSGNGMTNSSLITNIDFEASAIAVDFLKLKVNIDDSEVSNAAVYFAFCNNKVVTGGTSTELKIDNLESSTTYTFKCGVIDVDGNIKISEEKTYETLEKLLLYSYGDENTEITGGWKKTGFHAADMSSFNKYSDHMSIYSIGGSRIYCGTTNKIDLTNFSKLCIKVDGTNAEVNCAISTIDYFNNSGDGIVSTINREIDVSNYQGEYYIHFTVANGEYRNIREVWLE